MTGIGAKRLVKLKLNHVTDEIAVRNKRSFIQIIFHYTRDITPKRVTSGGWRVHLRGIAPGQHINVAAVASRWRKRRNRS